MATESDSSSKSSSLSLKASTASLKTDKAAVANNKAIKGWTDTSEEIRWDVKFKNTGPLYVALNLANDECNLGAKIEAEVGGERVSGVTRFSGGWKRFATMDLGTLQVKRPGRQTITIRALEIKGVYAGDLESVELSGPAAVDAVEDTVPPRADSVHLRWDDGGGCDMFYNQASVIESYPGTFFVACGFSAGYFGLQENDFTGRKIVLFSIWDPRGGKEQDPSKVADDDRVKLVAQGEGVKIKRFGNEGTGAQSLFKYSWKKFENYHFLVKAEANEKEKSVVYTGYFYLNETSQWKMIASYKVIHDGKLLTGLYSFVEDYFGVHGIFPRQSCFGPVWRRMPGDKWVEVPKAQFTQAGNLKNTTAGKTPDDRIFLCTGGHTEQKVQVNEKLAVKSCGYLPNILKNVDSKLPKQ